MADQEAPGCGSTEQMRSSTTSLTQHDIDEGLHSSSQILVEADNAISTQSSLTVRSRSRPGTPTGFFCRICHDRNLGERNISTCYCRGTLGLVHLSCLQTWLLMSDTTSCEICGYQYTVKRVPKYPVLKSIVFWYTHQRTTLEGRRIARNTTSLISEAPLVFAFNYLWLTKVDKVLEYMDDYESNTLDIHDEHVMMLARILNISLVSPVGMMSGCLLVVFVFRLFDLMRRWYLWHRKECVILIQLESQPNPAVQNSSE